MQVYGLTGGIGSGKSTVALMFAEAGAAVFDADAIGRALLSGQGPEARAVARRHPDCLAAEGIDRARLAERVFADPVERRWLEDLMHPAIRREFERQLAGLTRPRPPLALLEGAVLLESRTRFELAGLVVVTAPAARRAERLAERDGLDAGAIRRRMEAQLPESSKILQASHLIDNSGALPDTRAQVRLVMEQLLQENGGQR